MPKYTFEEIKTLLLKSINENKCEAELRLVFADKPAAYSIIIYAEHCSFQRCGVNGAQSGECKYNTLDELYRAPLIDDILLARDWDKIKAFGCFDFQVLGYWE